MSKEKKQQLKMRRRSNNCILYCFCGVFFVTLVFFAIYLCCSYKIFKDSQEKIATENVKHIAKVDSIFYDMKTVILSNDTGTIANAQALLSQLQNDSALVRREILLSQEEMKNLVTLHIDKIDNDYSQIGIWGGILSIIFLIFGFFAIFKIEETKTEARNVLDDVKEQGKDTINEVQSQASELSKSINDIRQESNNFIDSKTKVFEELVKNIKGTQTQSEEKLARIYKLTGDIENKNEQYNRSLLTMEKKMTQLEALINTLKEVLNNNRKEVSDEQ